MKIKFKRSLPEECVLFKLRQNYIYKSCRLKFTYYPTNCTGEEKCFFFFKLRIVCVYINPFVYLFFFLLLLFIRSDTKYCSLAQARTAYEERPPLDVVQHYFRVFPSDFLQTFPPPNPTHSSRPFCCSTFPCVHRIYVY